MTAGTGHRRFRPVGAGFVILGVLLVWAAVLGLACPALGAEPRVAAFIDAVPADVLVPGADRFGAPQGTPPVVPAYKGDRLVGYGFLNTDIVNATGYSGKPIHILVGIDLDGVITGARLVDHKEPIVLIGIPERKITAFIDGYVGMDVAGSAVPAVGTRVDIVSGATVTVMVIGDSIMRSALKVAQAHGLGGAQPAEAAAPAVRRAVDAAAGPAGDWATMVGDGTVRRLHLSVGEVNEAFARSGDAAAAARPEPGAPEDTFIDLHVALVSVPAIGRSLLGEAEYRNLVAALKPGQEAILVAGSGPYSFKGSGYVRGGIFDRIELIQGSEAIRFRDRTHRRVADLAADGAPDFREIGVFAIPRDVAFDPTAPWRLQLLVQRQVGALDKAFLTFDLGYALPDRYIAAPPAPTTVAVEAPAASAGPAAMPDEPLWKRIWLGKLVPIGILVAQISLLTMIFFFQTPLLKRPRLFDRLRLGFLVFTLVWLGWIAKAQLSVVNVLTFSNALLTDFQWDYFLMDPLIFILWFAVAAALLFWGRGPFCGWLCPFGALQELSNRVAKRLKVPQITVPWGVHERLWPIKYIIFLGLFGLSLYSLALAEQLSEIEPFKTAIILRFIRDWWFVAFAVALLAAGLFIERFFCRYLCPLGAALAIPGRMRMFDWLKRYKECGNPCRRCFNECPVQAIHPEGHINPNECISCLHCQVLYHHDRKCPVMIQKRVKREKRLALTSPSLRPDTPANDVADGGRPRPAARTKDATTASD